jgi:hypothetical protein
MDGWNYRRMTTMPTSDADRYAQLLQNLARRSHRVSVYA